ncbi:MAG: hmuV 1 [Gammaproteobacteria bacterium]|nr:hmuV 1 [Gammaproteobacteria bacterium]
MIIAKNLTLGFGKRILISHVNLTIEQGEFIGILGSNGSGKSTFLRAILGLIKPLKGTLSVLGRQPCNGLIQAGYIPQARTGRAAVYLTSRAILNATYQGTRYGLSLPSLPQKMAIQKVLELVEALSYADRPFHQLSGGEKQRVYLAQALLNEPRILLLDEPMSNLDPHYQEIFIHLLHEIQKKLNITILFTAHDPNPLLKVMDRVLFFAKGQAVIGTIEDVMTSTRLSALYGTRIEVIHVDNRLFVLGYGQNIVGEAAHHHD